MITCAVTFVDGTKKKLVFPWLPPIGATIGVGGGVYQVVSVHIDALTPEDYCEKRVPLAIPVLVVEAA